MANIPGGNDLEDPYLSFFHVMDGLLSSQSSNPLRAPPLSSSTQRQVSQMSDRPSYRNTNGVDVSNQNLNRNAGGAGYQNSRSSNGFWTPETARRDINQYLFNKFLYMLYLRDEDITVLITTKLGYKFFEELIQSVNDYHLQVIVRMITSRPERLINSLFTRNGSKSVQRLIKEIGNKDIVAELVCAISTGFRRLMTDRTAYLVILSCLDNTQRNELLYMEATMHCVLLATHEKGCISLNKFITSSNGHGRFQLLQEITDHTMHLSQDPFGNYVLQHVLALRDPVFTDKICYILRGHYVRLSLHKFGSHVVEKCLISPRMMTFVVLDFLTCGRLSKVAQDQYGNYVIQIALRVTKLANYQFYIKLLRKLQENGDARQFGYGRNVIELIMEGARETGQ